MFYLIIVLCALFLLITFAIIASKRKHIKRLQKIRCQWAKPKIEYFNFDFIESYSRVTLNSNKYILSQQTKVDIDFYDLFRYIDRTTSKTGQQYLFDRLCKPSDDLLHLQEFDNKIEFFINNIEVREKVQLIISELDQQNAYFIPSLLKKELASPPKWRSLLLLDSILVAILVMFLPFYPIALVLLMFLGAFNLFLHYWNKNNISEYIRSFPQLNILINTVKKIKKEKLPIQTIDVDSSIKSLNKFQKKLIYLSYGRYGGDELTQGLFFLIELLKAIFLIELRSFFALINIVKDRQQDVNRLFQYVGSIDSALSVASLRLECKQYCKPLFTNKIQELHGYNVFHPLIENCVPNSIKINGRSLVITGSNMSGKTSFLRTIALNSILAQTIYTCFAESFNTPFLKVHSSIRIDDDILEGKSFYLTEVHAMKGLIDEAQKDVQNLFILDEVFKGTNAAERIASSKAILSFLNRNRNIVFVATHDIELSELLNEEFDLYHFDETVQDGKLVFDHRLKKGPLRTRNAIKILEVEGFPFEIIKEAYEISNKLT